MLRCRVFSFNMMHGSMCFLLYNRINIAHLVKGGVVMDTFFFKGIKGVFQTKDREYHCQDGDYVRRPDGKLFRVEIKDRMRLFPVEVSMLPPDAVIVDLVKTN